MKNYSDLLGFTRIYSDLVEFSWMRANTWGRRRDGRACAYSVGVREGSLVVWRMIHGAIQLSVAWGVFLRGAWFITGPI